MPVDIPMFVRDIMSTEVYTLREDEVLLDATLLLARGSFRHIPILSGQRLVGIVTERDVEHYKPSILSGIPAEEYNRLMKTTPLSKIMSRNPTTIGPGKTVYEAAQILFEQRIGCLPVVEDGKLKGIITRSDMLSLLLKLLQERGLAAWGPAT